MGDNARFRPGARTLISAALEAPKAELDLTPERRTALAAELEEACFAASNEDGETRFYVQIFDGLTKALPEPYGEFLETTLAARVASGEMTCAAATAPDVHKAFSNINPRRRARALFYAFLSRDPRFDNEGEIATQIELGCYNATIARCVESADSYRRRWDSPMFLNIYSARVGVVVVNVDPAASVARGVGNKSWALGQLAAGAWNPGDLGKMTAAELCPEAGEEVRDEVRRRLNQKVEERTSALFACPRCRERNCTYRTVQIGSGDEPSSFMCTCKECGQEFEGHA